MPGSNGGTAAPLNLALYASYVFGLPGNDFLFTFDPTNFNDPLAASVYSYKVEDVIAGRTPTVNRVIISYFDLGVASLTVNLSGSNDEGQAVNATTSITIGNTVPLNIIITQLVGISLTGQNLQLTLVRNANAGPVCITKVRM